MTNAVNGDAPRSARRLVSVSTVAGWFGVATNTVHKWIYKDPADSDWPEFPPADYEIPTARPDMFVLAWEPSREAEIRQWKAAVNALPGRAWRKGQTGDVRYTTLQHVGKRPGRKRKDKGE